MNKYQNKYISKYIKITQIIIFSIAFVSIKLEKPLFQYTNTHNIKKGESDASNSP